MHDQDRFTQLLKGWQAGDMASRDELVPYVVDELHRSAERLMGRERIGHTLQPTALVNEAYLRLERRLADADFASRGHFFSLVLQTMRTLLVDHARRRNADKRGGNAVPADLIDGTTIGRGDDPLELLHLDELLERLHRADELASEVFARSHFLGLGREAIAELLDVSPRTVDRKLRLARMWLSDHLDRGRSAGTV